MMLDIKAWLETTGEPVADTAFTDETPVPFIVFLDTVERGGGDMVNIAKRHSLTVERYSATGEGDEKLEKLFDAKAIKYHKEKTWLKDEQCFMTTYDFDLLEREVIQNV
jgi:hypothetical protein